MSSTNVLELVRRVSSMGGRIESADSTLTLEDQDRGLHTAVDTASRIYGREFRSAKIVDAIDESGFTFAGGDTMDEVLKRVESGERAGVVFAYFDRSGRNWWEQGPFFKRLEAAGGFFVVAGMEAIDYRTPTGRQVFGSMSVASEASVFMAKDRGNNIATKVMERKVPNRLAYGLARNATFVDGKPVQKVDAHRDDKAAILADTAAVVRRIYTMRLDGYKVGAIAAVLNEEAVPGPTGGRWVTSTVSSILANPIYKGTITLGRRKRSGKRTVPGDNVRTTHDPAIAIVSATEWKNAQSAKTIQRTGNYVAGVAGGVLVCEACGGTMSVIGTGDDRRMYGCRRGTTKAKCPRPTNIKKCVMDDYVDGEVARVLSGRVKVKRANMDAVLADTLAALTTAENERAALKDKVSFTHPNFSEWLAEADEAVDSAQAAHDDAVDSAGRRDTLPTLDAYATWPVEKRSKLARDLFHVVVGPPLSRSKLAPILERVRIEHH